MSSSVNRFFPVFALLCLSHYSFCQYNTTDRGESYRLTTLPKAPPTNKSKAIRSAVAVPTLLIGTGVYVLCDDDFINRIEVREERNEHFPNFSHHADNYLQYLPIVAVYGLNLAGVKGENNFGNRTALLIKSEVIMAAITFSLKGLTKVPRPDTGDRNSFPSGHTAQAFAAATFMHKEYGGQSVMYSIGAYAVATGIGVMRILNNRHWASDVIAGAGIGILSTNLAYLTHQYKWGNKKPKHETFVMPTYSSGPGFYLSYKL
ncbi:MAG TPA: phosphatase PAP2 family protein [Cyclobacteriaceae bacterium]|nr:phosphatase PAP2 family protein [Cyclobacteriaceae bacterium]